MPAYVIFSHFAVSSVREFKKLINHSENGKSHIPVSVKSVDMLKKKIAQIHEKLLKGQEMHKKIDTL